MNSTDEETNTNASLPWKSGEKLLSSHRDPLFLTEAKLSELLEMQLIQTVRENRVFGTGSTPLAHHRHNHSAQPVELSLARDGSGRGAQWH